MRRPRCTVQHWGETFDDSNDSNPAVTYVKHGDVRPSSNPDISHAAGLHRQLSSSMLWNESVRAAQPRCKLAAPPPKSHPGARGWTNYAYGAVPCRALGGCRCYACGSGADRNRATASGRHHRLRAQCRQQTGDTGFKVGAALVRQRCAGNSVAETVLVCIARRDARALPHTG